MRTMYDSVTASNIPASAQMVAGYIDGRYAWSFADWQRFPNAVRVQIACFASTNAGVVLDVEQGDATPAQAPGWVLRRRAAGVDPTVYCSSSWWPTVRAAFAAQGVPEPHWWIAAYPGIGQNLYPGSVAHQYADPGPYDLSVVADYWPGVDSALSPMANVLASIPGVADVPTLAPIKELDVPLTPDDLTAITNAVWAGYTINNRGYGPAHTDQFLLDTRADVDTINHKMDALAAQVAAIAVPAATGIDYAALAKAVNDDAAHRMEA